MGHFNDMYIDDNGYQKEKDDAYYQIHRIQEKKGHKLTHKDRRDIIVKLTERPRHPCDLCGDMVTFENLSGWDEDGHVYCTAHGPLATVAEE